MATTMDQIPIFPMEKWSYIIEYQKCFRNGLPPSVLQYKLEQQQEMLPVIWCVHCAAGICWFWSNMAVFKMVTLFFTQPKRQISSPIGCWDIQTFHLPFCFWVKSRESNLNGVFSKLRQFKELLTTSKILTAYIIFTQPFFKRSELFSLICVGWAGSKQMGGKLKRKASINESNTTADFFPGLFVLHWCMLWLNDFHWLILM